MSKKNGSKPDKPERKAASVRKSTATTRRRTRMIALEPRMLFDGALGIDLATQSGVLAKADAPASESAGAHTAEAAVAPASFEAQKDVVRPDADRPVADASVAPAYPKELVFIDSTLTGAQQLAEAARTNVEVHMLDPARDGV